MSGGLITNHKVDQNCGCPDTSNLNFSGVSVHPRHQQWLRHEYRVHVSASYLCRCVQGLRTYLDHIIVDVSQINLI